MSVSATVASVVIILAATPSAVVIAADIQAWFRRMVQAIMRGIIITETEG